MNVNVGTVPASYQTILADLRKVEGGVLHYNSNEKDITNGYGIYKGMHAQAEIFQLYDEAARALGITGPSAGWRDTRTLGKIQEYVNKNLAAEEYWLSYVFYQNYFRNLSLERYHPVIASIMVSLYTNGTKLAGTSFQRAINVIHNKHNIATAVTEDGILGPGSVGAIIDICNASEAIITEFKYLILLFAKSYYATLVANNSAAYLQYLRGWDNRVNTLI
jgi:hypothetical protein|nr:MAG TPA: hypothetical protein [Caudoviricetes sp.]